MTYGTGPAMAALEPTRAHAIANGAHYRGKPLESMTRCELIEAVLTLGKSYRQSLKRHIRVR